MLIEITEHELAPEDGALEAGLAELRGRGARIAIDDAGAGYAGLQQVMRVQPDIIKLDRSLVEAVDDDGAKAALIEFFVNFARRIEADVCCEGIETPPSSPRWRRSASSSARATCSAGRAARGRRSRPPRSARSRRSSSRP